MRKVSSNVNSKFLKLGLKVIYLPPKVLAKYLVSITCNLLDNDSGKFPKIPKKTHLVVFFTARLQAVDLFSAEYLFSADFC